MMPNLEVVREFQNLFEELCGYLTQAHRVTERDHHLAVRVNNTIGQVSQLLGRNYSRFEVHIEMRNYSPWVSTGEYYSNLEALVRRLRSEWPIQTAVSPPIPPPPGGASQMLTISNTNENHIQITQELMTYLTAQLAKPLPENQKALLKELGDTARNGLSIAQLLSTVAGLAVKHKVELAALAALFSQHIH